MEISQHNSALTKATREQIGLRRFVGQFRTGVPREQLTRLAGQTPINSWVTIPTVILAATLLHPHIADHWVALWVMGHFSLLAVIVHRWRRSIKKTDDARPDMRPTRRGLRRAVAWAVLSGGIWGSLAAFLPLLPPLEEMAIILVMAGMAAGASTTLAAVPQVAMIFIIGCTGPTTVYFLSLGDPVRTTMALMAMAFTAAMLATTRVVYLSLIRQLLAERRSERFRAAHLQEKIASIANQEVDTRTALGACLKEVCGYLGWPVGHLYMLAKDGSGNLLSSNIWHMEDAGRFEAFRQASTETAVKCGSGLAGRALEKSKPVWLEGLADLRDFGRRELAQKAGIRSGFAFPVLVKEEVVAVLEFFSTEVAPPDEQMLEVMAPVGVQIGRAIERHQAAEALRKSEFRLRAVVDNSVQGIIVHNAGVPIFVNEQGARIYGYSTEELMKLGSIFDLVHPDDRERLAGYTRARNAGEDAPDAYEYTGVHKDGHSIPVYTRSTILEWNNQRAVVSTLFDMTDLKQAESDLLQSERALRRRVDELEEAQGELKRQEMDLRGLNEELTDARDRAEAGSRAKSEFLAAMSHELRTPLNAVIGFSEMIKGETFGPVGDSRYLEYAVDINESGVHLLTLVNDILDLAKVETGKDELHEIDVDVENVSRSALKLVSPRARELGIELALDIENGLPLLRADERKLKQILVNILSNAIKFNRTNGSVGLHICNGAEGFVFRISDTGIGIADVDIPKALSKFGQVDGDLNRKYEGTGLGLPLAAAFADQHGGSIRIESEIGKGTAVTIGFPASRAIGMENFSGQHHTRKRKSREVVAKVK